MTGLPPKLDRFKYQLERAAERNHGQNARRHTWSIRALGEYAFTLTFLTYEELPNNSENLALLSITAQHPGAELTTSTEAYLEAVSTFKTGFKSIGRAEVPEVR